MSDLNAALAAIWERSRPLVRERLEKVEAAASAMQAGTLDEEARAEGVRASHQLAGSLGTFGMEEGTDVARELEGEFGGSADPARVADLSARLRALLEPRLG
jgi:HPt (histidine-containing phosphotransfer) domain-containing protein